MGKDLLGSLELNRIYQRDTLEGLNLIPNESVDLIIADPPYFGVVKDTWDNQWRNDYTKFKEWVAISIKEYERVLKVGGTVYFYGWFHNLIPLHDVINEHFFIRQNITVHKGLRSIAGRTSSKLKMYPTATEYIWILTKQDTIGKLKNGKSIIDPIHDYLNKARIDARLTLKDINKIWGHPENSGTAAHKFNDKSQPQPLSKEKYEILKAVMNLPLEHDELIKIYESKRIKFNLPQGVTDVWEINFYKDEKHGHSTQKPLELCERIIKTSSDEGDVILVPFVGSGSECVMAKELSRNFIGFELESKYIEIANLRLDAIFDEIDDKKILNK